MAPFALALLVSLAQNDGSCRAEIGPACKEYQKLFDEYQKFHKKAMESLAGPGTWFARETCLPHSAKTTADLRITHSFSRQGGYPPVHRNDTDDSRFWQPLLSVQLCSSVSDAK
jgi:hypothetical protein